MDERLTRRGVLALEALRSRWDAHRARGLRQGGRGLSPVANDKQPLWWEWLPPRQQRLLDLAAFLAAAAVAGSGSVTSRHATRFFLFSLETGCELILQREIEPVAQKGKNSCFLGLQ